MTSKDFNKKYNLSFNGIDTPFAKVSNQKNFVNVAGKPKKLVLEILKRYFKSWPSVLFLIIFLILLILSIVVTLTSSYSATQSVSKVVHLNLIGDKIGQQTDSSSIWSQKLPNQWADLQTLNKYMDNSTFQNYNNDFIKNYGGFFNKIITQKGNETILNRNNQLFIDPYKWYLNHSIYLVFQYSDIPNNLSQTQYQQLYQEALNANPQLHLGTFLGTTNTGVDVWTRSWIGTWKAIRLAIIVALLQTLIGVIIGAYLGFHIGTWIDTVIMRLIDIFSAPPTLIWLLIFVSLFGTTDLTLGIALVFIGWVGAVNGTRLFIITIKDSEFITVSKSVGASKLRLIYKHALPMILGKIATRFVASIPGIILAVSSLAFLGFFKNDNDVNLGEIINSAVGEAGNNFWTLLLPSLILLSLSVSLHFIALGVHDALDPKVIKTK
ncbi:oligopeptide transport system permease protein [Mycoplasmopsis mustelae]|uniref:Oligopeptide transport system permease protein n=1 Tax=Mycoplasmopsis mustelae TaxID=171289 RepID=A0A4V3FNZ5_9BACT|nr:ABC transporter permease [Mycoplasmopsis mustelae]TDV24410.1 oligopeptide transport system permease protein [Mycoplasmopsis mustelae]